MTPDTQPAPALPTWEEMTDVDKGCALLHLWKREWEGSDYAVAEYPCRYLDDPRLTALTPREACRHAVDVAASHDAVTALLGEDEHQRLYDLALDEPDRRCLWGARYPRTMLAGANDDVAITSYSTDPQRAARDLIASWADRGHPGGVLVHRSEPGGEWSAVDAAEVGR